MNDTNMAVMEPAQQVAPIADNPANLMAMIARAASDPSCDVEKMERLMVMRREMQQEQAEYAFNDAMQRVQAKMRRIGTDARNRQTNSDYATYAKLDRVLRPIYTEEGFALSFGTDDSPSPETLMVTCHVSHSAGFTRKYVIPMPSDGKGAKGNDVMTKTHATGSAAQYGMRYLLKMIFNVAIGDDPDDDDGNGASAHKLSPAEAKAIHWIDVANKLDDIAEYGRQREKLLKEYGSAGNLPPDVRFAFNKAKAACEPKDVE